MRLFSLLFGLGLLIYVCLMIVTRIPAGWGAYFVQSAAPNLQLSAVTGTVWNGEAANAKITIDGKTIDLGRLTWHLEPLALFQMRACAKVRSDLLGGDVCRSANNVNMLSDLVVNRLPAQVLNDAMGASLFGHGDITVNRFHVKDNGDILDLEGHLTWENAAIDPRTGTGRMELGNYAVALTENGTGGLYADITDLSGEFDVDIRGDIKLREMPKLTGTIRPSANAPNPIVQALSIFAEPLDDGGFRINFPGG